LIEEAKIYQIMRGGKGIPKYYWSGTEGEYNILVMELLGPSIEDLLPLCKNKFSIATVIALSDQLVFSYLILLNID
jgi:serine/threonine protein kinase